MNTFFKRSNAYLLILFLTVRAASFFLKNIPIGSEIIGALAVGLFIYACFKNRSAAWTILVLELLLDGAGHFFEFRSLLLRTWLLGIFACFWLWKIARTKKLPPLPPKNILISFGVFGAFLLWALIGGFLHDHNTTYVIQDAILYLFALLLFPALDFEIAPNPIYETALRVFIWGSAIFSGLTLALYSSGVFFLTDPYYHWFRNVAAGKITDLGAHFFRIVLPEQLFFVPIILVLLSLLIKKSEKKWWLLLAPALFVLTLNFTRIYILALAVSALTLLYRESWKQMLKISALSLGAFLLIFFGTHIAASRGQSLGLELLGVRVTGVRAPTTDPSGAIRLALLPDIKKTITQHPLLGSGLGTTATYVDPITGQPQTRTQFDWGYFEMIAELGILGTLAYLAFLGTILYNFARATKLDTPLSRGLFAGALSLFIINITTPALFQGFGILYFIYLSTHTKPLNVNDHKLA